MTMEELQAAHDLMEAALGNANDKIEKMTSDFGTIWETSRKWA